MSFNPFNLRKIFSVIKLSSFDTKTSEGRSLERYRRASLSTIALGVSKGIGIATSLVTIPLTINYLGTERYGLWMTISSTIAILSFADLGIGNGLLNAVSEANGKDDRKSAQTSVSSAFFILSAIAILLLALFTLSYQLIPWSQIFNVRSDVAALESGPTMVVLVACFAINMPLGVTQRVQMGYQEDFKNQLWSILGSSISLVAILGVVFLKGGLPWLVLAFAGGPVLAQLLNTVILFFHSRRWLLPKVRNFDWIAVKKLMGLGIWFFAFQLLTVLGITSDNLVIAHFLGASSVALFAIPQKIFGAAFFSQFIVSSLWSAFGEAIARGDKSWASRTLIRAVILCTSLGFLSSSLLLIFGKQLIRVWAGEALVPSTALLLGFAVWLVMISYGAAIQIFLNSCSLIKEQTVFNFIASFVSLVFKIIFVLKFGKIEAMIWCGVVAYGTFYIFPITVLALKYFR
jgi:O-antigen/teichoic acid export membrane protein